MKSGHVKAIVAPALALGTGAAFLAWYPFLFSLAWPGLILAQAGVPHSWLIAAALIVGLMETSAGRDGVKVHLGD